MNTGFLIDTDVLIEYLRGRKPAIEYLECLELKPSVSVISVAELYSGVRNKQESDALDLFLQAFDIIEVNLEIARQGGYYRKTYGPSNGIGLADALIAATAGMHDLELVTFNLKHYPMILNVRIPYSKNE
jgi:predicted nucleic acid-binding protein